MLVTLEATAGPIAGRKIEIRAGAIVRLGRTAKADYAIGEDSYLSGQHFAVECDGTQCRVRDLGSSNGTFVNGERVTETVVVNERDSLVAGGSTFTIHIDADAAPPQPAESERVNTSPTATYSGSVLNLDRTIAGPQLEGVIQWPGFSRAQSVLLNALYREGETVFAILDAMRDSRIPAFLDASGEPCAIIDSLVRGSPYVVVVPAQARLLDVLIKDGWSHGWGFYATSRAGLEEACAHWRGYLTLHNGRGQPLTFRFWDPRVLRAILPAMTPQEAADFFGPLDRMIVEGEKAQMAMEFSLTPRGPKQQALVLV
jgi:pSer/pThr/pTyr-binding forkhead associated (FHA) protein